MKRKQVGNVRKKEEGNQNKGMTTIEACILIPFVYFLTMLLLFLGFFLYNRNLMHSAASVAVMEGSLAGEDSIEKILEKADTKSRELLEGKLIWMDLPEITVEADLTTITIQMHGVMTVPGAALLEGIYGDTVWEMEVEKKMPRLFPSRFVRTMEGIRDGLSANEINWEETIGEEAYDN